MSTHAERNHEDVGAPNIRRLVFPSGNLTPWNLVVIWGIIRLWMAEATDIDLVIAGGLLHPLIFETIRLAATAGIVGIAKLLSWPIRNTATRVLIALATYVAIPSTHIYLKTVLAPPPAGESYLSELPEGIILSIYMGVVAVLWASPRSVLRGLELSLDQANKQLIALQDSISEQKHSLRRKLKLELKNIAGPEIEKVLELLNRGAPHQQQITQLSSQIRSSVNEVLRPLAKRLITDTSRVHEEQVTTRRLALRRLSFWEPITLKHAVNPVLVGSIPLASLSIRWARDLSLTWPESLYVLTFSATLVALVVVLSSGLKSLVPATRKINPLAAFAVVAIVNAALTYLPIAITTNFPRDFLAYETWGFLSTFPAAGLSIALISPAMAVGALMIARQLDVIERKEDAYIAIIQLNAELSTELWHLQRQAGFMVHGPIQTALTSIGLQLQKNPRSAERPGKLVAVLEETLRNLAVDQPADSLSSFLESLQNQWAGVATLRVQTLQPAMRAVEKSPESLHACKEAIREGVNNSIFHGLASEIHITVTMLNSKTVHIRVEDNGRGPSPKRTLGVGSDLLNTVSTGWNILRIAETTVFTANLLIDDKTQAELTIPGSSRRKKSSTRTTSLKQ